MSKRYPLRSNDDDDNVVEEEEEEIVVEDDNNNNNYQSFIVQQEANGELLNPKKIIQMGATVTAPGMTFPFIVIESCSPE